MNCNCFYNRLLNYIMGPIYAGTTKQIRITTISCPDPIIGMRRGECMCTVHVRSACQCRPKCGYVVERVTIDSIYNYSV